MQRAGTGSALLLIGAFAAALDVIFFAKWSVYLAGVDLCSCIVRQSALGRTIDIAILVAALAAVPLTMVGLDRLSKTRRLLASAVAVVLISPQVALLIAILMRELR